jgi:DNA-binding transcriptional ArsR family regulator
MSSTDETQLDVVFRALSDATRRDIIRVTVRDEFSVSALSHRYDMSFAAVQKHVAVLERAGLVVKHQRGKEQLVCGNIETVRRATKLLNSYEKLWLGRIERINDILSTTPRRDPKK